MYHSSKRRKGPWFTEIQGHSNFLKIIIKYLQPNNFQNLKCKCNFRKLPHRKWAFVTTLTTAFFLLSLSLFGLQIPGAGRDPYVKKLHKASTCQYLHYLPIYQHLDLGPLDFSISLFKTFISTGQYATKIRSNLTTKH